MTTMVERIAKAMLEELESRRLLEGVDDDLFGEIGAALAVAALREMREPTEGMVQSVLLSARDRAASEGATELRPEADYAKEYVGQSFSAAIDAEIAAYEGKK